MLCLASRVVLYSLLLTLITLNSARFGTESVAAVLLRMVMSGAVLTSQVMVRL